MLQDLHTSLITPTLVSPSLQWPDTMRGMSGLNNGSIGDGLDSLHQQEQQQQPQHKNNSDGGVKDGQSVGVKGEPPQVGVLCVRACVCVCVSWKHINKL